MPSFAKLFETRCFHGVVLVAGFAFVLTGAFHGNVWFDESYSVAIANHSFAEIWDIGSGDVHPVLFYWALHALNLIFGQNVTMYRLFAALGALALAWLGYSIVRRDFGWRAGLLFSFLCLFMPYVAYESVEIRMYSWATFTVTVCALFAWRIACVLKGGAMADAGQQNEGWWTRIASAAASSRAPRWVGVPFHWWLIFFVSSVASAYLHYYGAIAAFLVNVFLLAFMAARFRSHKALLVLLAGAAVQLALYAPWLAVVANQVGVVSGSYWAEVEFPRTFVEWAFYPLATSYVVFADTYGAFYVVALGACAALAIVSGAGLLVRRLRSKKEMAQSDAATAVSLRRLRTSSSDRLPMVWGLALYVSVFAVALAASVAMDSLIVYYRYLSVALGPLILSLSLLVSRFESAWCVAGLLAAFLGTACISQSLFVQDAYSSKNEEPLIYFEEVASQGDGPLVLSSDIGIEGVTAVSCPDVNQVFLAWQEGNWAKAYQCYSPTLACIDSWDQALSSYQGEFMVLGQTSKEAVPVDVTDLEARPDVVLVSSKTFYRPYERTWFTVAVMEKE